MNGVLEQHYRLAAGGTDFTVAASLSDTPGFFRFGPHNTCYGRCAHAHPAPTVGAALPDLFADVRLHPDTIQLPFDPTQVLENLRNERYFQAQPHSVSRSLAGDALVSLYYFMRPLMSVPVRSRLQRLRLGGWQKIAFPRWPVATRLRASWRHSLSSH